MSDAHMTTVVDETRRHGDYLIRTGDETDRTEFVRLRSEVFGTWPESDAVDVFDWKYVDNPYIRGVPLIVVEHDDTIVAGYGYLVFEMAFDGEPVVGIQGTDAVVHPDHRGRGLFTEMVGFGHDCYRSDEALLWYGFPLSDAREILQYRGLYDGEIATDVFLHPNDDDWIRYDGSGRRVAALLKALRLPLYRLAMGAVELSESVVGTVAARSRPDIEVTRHETPPGEELQSLYERAIPDGLHVRRDEQFYEYRLRDPRFQFTTYVARRDGEPVAAVTTSRGGTQGSQFMVRDIIPFAGESRPLRAALSRALGDRPEGHNTKAWCSPGRRWTLLRSGFVPIRLVPSKSDRKSNPVARSERPGVDGTDSLDGVPETWALQALDCDF